MTACAPERTRIGTPSVSRPRVVRRHARGALARSRRRPHPARRKAETARGGESKGRSMRSMGWEEGELNS
jgi:hypothetical protein